MSLLQMSFAGGVLILAVIVLRALTLNRLPKGTFLALWAVAVVRLLVPFSIPSPASVYTLAERVPVREHIETITQTPVPAKPVAAAGTFGGAGTMGAAHPTVPVAAPEADVWSLFWIAGVLVCAGVFLLSYLRSRRAFLTARPVEEGWGPVWLARHKLRRPVAIRQSGNTDVPLTYGILRPVILLPEGRREDERLEWVLEHEFAHIRRFDGVCKLVLAATACVHWFNPLVWVMLALANRDMELRCDEAVVRRLGLERRGDYARALISMEEQKSGLGPFASAFNKSAIEERIIAIMKTKKRSLAAVLAAAALVCCVGVAFATSAAAENERPYPKVPDGTFTGEELDRLASLWFEGYEDMTVAAYQKKMWGERDTPEDIALIDRYGQNSVVDGFYDDPEAVTPSRAFSDYFHLVYEPLTAERWQERIFIGAAGRRLADGGSELLEYTYTLCVLDREKLTVEDYEQAHAAVKAGVKGLLGAASVEADLAEADFIALSQSLSTEALVVTVEAGLPVRDFTADQAEDIPVKRTEVYVDDPYERPDQWGDTARAYHVLDPDAALHAQSSRESADEWDRVLSPYTAFGLTYHFDDPDLDGNGLTMWFEGKEVRGIYDEREGVWITEHTGNGSYGPGAVELYTVYTDGVLSGLRTATPKEQAGFDKDRQNATLLGIATAQEEREFPQATEEDYDAFLALRQVDDPNLPPYASHPYWDTRDLTLEEFNQRLLDWANENSDAYDRINCDVIWNDYGVALSEEERAFVSVTCRLSGTENGQMIRALYAGAPEQDPGFSASMPERTAEEGGIVTAWCDLYYDLSYHVADKSAVTVAERDACVGGMINAINAFWQDTDFDALLQMSEADVVEQFNIWAAEHSTENVQINPITADSIHFEHNDERGID